MPQADSGRACNLFKRSNCQSQPSQPGVRRRCLPQRSGLRKTWPGLALCRTALSPPGCASAALLVPLAISESCGGSSARGGEAGRSGFGTVAAGERELLRWTKGGRKLCPPKRGYTGAGTPRVIARGAQGALSARMARCKVGHSQPEAGKVQEKDILSGSEVHEVRAQGRHYRAKGRAEQTGQGQGTQDKLTAQANLRNTECAEQWATEGLKLMLAAVANYFFQSVPSLTHPARKLRETFGHLQFTQKIRYG